MKRLLSSATRSRSQTLPLIHEVTPRDGLQNEPNILSPLRKAQLISKLGLAGFESIEITSFVREDLVPAMGGRLEMCRLLSEMDYGNPRLVAFTPNLRGYQDVSECSNYVDIRAVAVLVSASESHSKANVNMTMANAFKASKSVVKAAKADGRVARAYISLAFGCPFEGAVDEKLVEDLARGFVEAGADEVVLADTIGCATVAQVESLCDLLKDHVGILGLHMHDTHQTAKFNIAAGFKKGVRSFDSSTGGCGGCNFVPNAKGNQSTQEVLNILKAFNNPHPKVDVSEVEAVASWLADELNSKSIVVSPRPYDYSKLT